MKCFKFLARIFDMSICFPFSKNTLRSQIYMWHKHLSDECQIYNYYFPICDKTSMWQNHNVTFSKLYLLQKQEMYHNVFLWRCLRAILYYKIPIKLIFLNVCIAKLSNILFSCDNILWQHYHQVNFFRNLIFS